MKSIDTIVELDEDNELLYIYLQPGRKGEKAIARTLAMDVVLNDEEQKKPS